MIIKCFIGTIVNRSFYVSECFFMYFLCLSLFSSTKSIVENHKIFTRINRRNKFFSLVLLYKQTPKRKSSDDTKPYDLLLLCFGCVSSQTAMLMLWRGKRHTAYNFFLSSFSLAFAKFISIYRFSEHFNHKEQQL